LVELVPTATRIGVFLTNLQTAAAQARVRELPATSGALGRPIEVLLAPDSRQIEAVFASLAEKRINALYVPPEPDLCQPPHPDHYDGGALCDPSRVWRARDAEAGGLMSYGADTADDWRIVGNYVGRILKGEKPGDLPVQQPSKFQFVINLQTARLLGLTVPPTLLAIADEVIE
jgi:putative ABC transport system substrate-binding protein